MGDGDFSFLNDEQGDYSPYQEGTPESFKRKMSNFNLQEQRKDQGPQFTGLSEDTSEGEDFDQDKEFQKSRAQAADFAKKQTFNGVDRLHAAVNTNRPGGPAFDPEQVKSQIMGVDPSQYAEEFYKLVKGVNVPQPGTGQPAIDENSIMSPVEDAVTSYKQLQMENAASANRVQQTMEPGDIANAQAQMQSLDRTIEQTKQRMALAATSRQRDKLKNDLDFYSSQKRVLQAKIPPQG